jgi:ECF sigma factor
MTSGSSQSVTNLLHACASGNQAALDELLPLGYEELPRQAKRYMRAQSVGHTLQSILVDHARARRAAKRGGAARAIMLDDEVGLPGPEASVDVLALHEALVRLADLDRGRVNSWTCEISVDSGSRKRRPC